MLAAAASARAEIRLPAIAGDHMVLQRGDAALWGTAAPGSTITADVAGIRASGVADAAGAWRIALGAALAAGGPFDLTLDGDGSVVLHDVLIGDVWLGAGQSNMALPVRTASDGAPPASADDCRELRFFTVERAVASAPLRDVRGAWRVCTPQSAADFSAVAYFFGRDLTAALGVPVGLVVAAWGSTPIDVWRPDASRDAASAADGTHTTGNRFALSVADLRLVPREPTRAPLPIALDASSEGLGGAWRAAAKPGSSARWSDGADEPHGGSFSGDLADPDAWASASTPLRAAKAPVDLTDFARIAFRARGDGEFRLTLGQASITDGDQHASEIIVAGNEWKSYEVALDALKQGGWGARQAFARDAVTTVGFAISAPPPRTRGVVFDAMVAPLARLRLRGVLWYQGETDVGHADDYAGRLASLIGGWRAALDAPALPFVVVQLPAYGAVAAEPAESRWAELREAQRTAAQLPATAVVTTIDLGDANDIHPKRKAEVGRRLARAAERVAYGRDVSAAALLAPTPSAATSGDGGRVRVRFAGGTTKLATRDDAPVLGFAVSADGRTFRWASARIVDGTNVEVWNDDVSTPVALRYAWADSPVCNLIGDDGLPVSPFALPVTHEAAASDGATATARSPGASAASRGSDPPPAPAAH